MPPVAITGRLTVPTVLLAFLTYHALDAARWLLRSEIDWWDLVRYGPPGFEAYVRIAFADYAEDVGGEDPVLRQALATLAGYTTTPDIA